MHLLEPRLMREPCNLNFFLAVLLFMDVPSVVKVIAEKEPSCLTYHSKLGYH